MLMDAFIKGDVYIDYPFEQAKFRYEKESGKVYRRFYGQAEEEILPDRFPDQPNKWIIPVNHA